MLSVFISQIGIAGPGLKGWQQSRDILAGRQAYITEEYQKPATSILPKNEHRRTTSLIKLALSAAQDAVSHCAYDAAELSSVFASADGDLEITDKLCHALTLPDRPVSPTNFHNSVHNAPAGYWSIATHSHAPSTSICACDYTFAAGLLEAACQTRQGPDPVLLVAYDYPPPFPLSAKRPFTDPLAVALVLTGHADARSLCELRLTLEEDKGLDIGCAEPLISLDNPCACALQLLQPIASSTDRELNIAYNQRQLLNISLHHAINT